MIEAVKRKREWLSKAGFCAVFVGFAKKPFVMALHSV
jgi:hypothetical protein